MQFFQLLLQDIKGASTWEWLAVISGISSVWFSRKASVWTYPVGLVSTIGYIFISLKSELFGEASVNFYYTIMSVYGWYLWLRRNDRQEELVQVEYSSRQMIKAQWLFFITGYAIIFISLTFLKKYFYGAVPWADAFASATAFTGMWLMARKKVESWYWWIATNVASIPLYYHKHLPLTSVYYFILLVFAFWGLAAWRKKASST